MKKMKNENAKGYAIICLWCDKNKTIDDTSNTCEECLNKEMVRINKAPSPLSGEWGRHQKQELEANSKDVLQPFKKDGTVNKHFIQAHGTRALEKELKQPKEKILKEAERYG